MTKENQIKRFWSKVNKTETCWLWQGARFPKRWRLLPYGRFCMGRAHRYSWEIHNGSIPEGMDVLHTCDTPFCVNPDHLFLGTHAENMKDKAIKGRCNAPVGDKCPARKLSSKDVTEIRTGKYAGLNQTAIAATLGVTQGAISRIVRGKQWRTV